MVIIDDKRLYKIFIRKKFKFILFFCSVKLFCRILKHRLLLSSCHSTGCAHLEIEDNNNGDRLRGWGCVYVLSTSINISVDYALPTT